MLDIHAAGIIIALQFWRHMRALILKRYQYFKRDLKSVFFLIVIPIAIIFALIGILQGAPFDEKPDLLLNTAPFNLGLDVPDRIPFFDYKAYDPVVG